MNLTASYILYPGFLSADKQFFLNMAVSLAVRELCEEVTGHEIRIKWPNDIYHRNKKLAGILIENTISGSQISSSVIGIGLNVNQTSFDPDLPNPTSVKLITGHETPIDDIIPKLNSCLLYTSGFLFAGCNECSFVANVGNIGTYESRCLCS